MSLDPAKSIKSGDMRLTRSTFRRDARTPLPEHSRKRYFMITTSLPPDARHINASEVRHMPDMGSASSAALARSQCELAHFSHTRRFLILIFKTVWCGLLNCKYGITG